jgi:hypothetical protein
MIFSNGLKGTFYFLVLTTAYAEWNLKQTEHVQWNSMKRIAQLSFHEMVQEQPKFSLG